MNCSAPRVLRQASGDLIVETACVPAMNDRPTIGGLLLWKDQENYLWLMRGLLGDREIVLGGCVADEEIIFGRGGLCESAERVTLRLVRAGSQVNALCSTNGVEWHAVGQAVFSVQDPVQIGVCAHAVIDRLFYPGAYRQGTAIRFESFQMWAR
jgi:hypothetical protein